MASRVAKARMSAQETLLRHLGSASTAALALMTVSNPSPANDRLSGWSFSAVLLGEAIMVEASQPYDQTILSFHVINNTANCERSHSFVSVIYACIEL